MAGQMVLMCGRSFSGKSTVAALLAESLGGAVVSLDAINEERGLYGGEGVPIVEWARTNELARERVSARLGADLTVIVDDTSSPRFLRDEWRSVASQAGAPMVLVFVDTPAEAIRQRLLENRASRQRGDVIDEVMAAHLESFEPPDEKEGPVLLQVGTGQVDLKSLTAVVQRSLNQSH